MIANKRLPIIFKTLYVVVLLLIIAGDLMFIKKWHEKKRAQPPIPTFVIDTRCEPEVEIYNPRNDRQLATLVDMAESGDVKAQYSLTEYYGSGDHKDKKHYWMVKAAESGFSTAQFELGASYESGYFTPKDKNLSFYWQLAARKNGCKGVAYSISYPTLVKNAYFLEKAMTGDVAAQYELSFTYEKPYKPDVAFISKHSLQRLEERRSIWDHEKRLYWLTQSAEGGYPAAQRHLGKSYREGAWLPKNPERAFYWINRAAHQGDLTAQLILSALYSEGSGVEKSPLLAYQWALIYLNNSDYPEIFKQSEMGKEADQRMLASKAERLTPAQIEQARQAAARFVPKPER